MLIQAYRALTAAGKVSGAAAALLLLGMPASALAQDLPDPIDPVETPADDPAPLDPAPADPAPADPFAPTPTTEAVATELSGVRLHVLDTRDQYAEVELDVYDVATRRVVASGTSTDEAAGKEALMLELDPGLYKVVTAGAPFNTSTNFATVMVAPGATTDFVIVVDSVSNDFRGSGVVTTALPTGVKIAGIEVSLSGGGSLMLNQQRSVVGQTSGTTAVYGIFANFGLVFDRGNHYLDVRSDLELTLLDQQAASAFATSDIFSAEALYAYNINNPWVGPYARASFQTSVFPSYLFMQSDADEITLTKQQIDGTTLTETYGDEANQDNLRVELAPEFAPIVLQEELGANLKAVSLDLLLVKLNVASRVGYGLRQGLSRGLYVVEGDSTGPTVTLNEVDDYDTHGPVVGADGQITVTRWLFGKAGFDVMAPVKDTDRAGDDFVDRLLWSLSATGGFRLPILTDLLEVSLDYSLRVEKDGYFTSDVQVDQTIMARGRVTLF